MRHHNSLLHQLLQFVPWRLFDRLVDEHGADTRVRRLTTRSQLIALIYAQLSGAQSLREIEQAMASHEHRLYHLGAAAPARSTLADANAKRPAQLFADLFAVLAAQASPVCAAPRARPSTSSMRAASVSPTSRVPGPTIRRTARW